jgi:hypothetical protein
LLAPVEEEEEEEEEEEPLGSTPSVPPSDQAPKEFPVNAEISFRIINSDLTLAPVSNVFPINSLLLTVRTTPEVGNVVFLLPQEISALFTPSVIHWLEVLKICMRDLHPTTDTPPTDTPPTPTPHGDRSSTKRTPRATALSEASYHLVFSVIVNHLEIACRCGRRKTDTIFAVGIQSLHAMAYLVSRTASCSIRNIYAMTQAPGERRQARETSRRLFELSIPAIDVLVGPKLAVARVESIAVLFSTERLEDLATIREMWVSPLLALTTEPESDAEPDPTSPRAERTSFLVEPPPPVQSDPVPHATQRARSQFAALIDVRKTTVEMRHSAGTGQIMLSLPPIRADHSAAGTFAQVTSIVVSGTGQLAVAIETRAVTFTKNGGQWIAYLNRLAVRLGGRDEVLCVGAIKRIILFNRGVADDSAVLLFSIDRPQLQLCSQTVNTLTSFYHAVIDPIFVSMKPAPRRRSARLSGNSFLPPRISKSAPKPPAPANGTIFLLAGAADIEIFKYYLRDNDRASLKVEGIFLAATIRTTEDIARNLTLKLRPIVLDRLTSQGHSQPTIRTVLRLPQCSGNLNTVQQGFNVSYDFVTSFNDVVEPSLVLTDYETVIMIIKYVAAQLLGDSKKAEKAAVPSEKPKWDFTQGKYDFNPEFKIGIGSSVKPDVVWVLTQLGISDQHTIPHSLFEYLLLNLEKALVAVSS